MKRLTILAAITILSLGAIWVKPNVTLNITSDPPGAEVYIDKDKVGVTPLRYNVVFQKTPRGEWERKVVEARLHCYKTQYLFQKIDDQPNINFVLQKETDDPNCTIPPGQAVYYPSDGGRVLLDITYGNAVVTSSTSGLKDGNAVVDKVWVSVSFGDPARAHDVVVVLYKGDDEAEVKLIREGRYARGSTTEFKGKPVVGMWKIRIKGETLSGIGIYLTIDCDLGSATSSSPQPSTATKSELQLSYESIKVPPNTGKKPYAAIMDLRGIGGKEMGDIATALSDAMRTEITNTGHFKVCDRANMEVVLKEIGFSQSGCTSSECVVQVGRMLSAEKIITGSISKLGDTYNITLQMIDVATGLVEKSVSEKAACKEGDLFYLVGIAARKLCL